jgi:hypothetical protein
MTFTSKDLCDRITEAQAQPDQDRARVVLTIEEAKALLEDFSTDMLNAVEYGVRTGIERSLSGI